MKMKHLATLLTGILMIGLVSCEYVTIEPKDVILPVVPADFTTEIEPIFTQLNCISCHTDAQEPNLTAGKAYTSLVTLNLVDTLNPSGSVLMQKINAGHNTSNITAAQKALILRWITEGAKGVIVQDPPVKLSTDVQPLFTLHCISCHGGSVTPDLRSGKSYTSLTTNNLVIPKNPGGSKLWQKINTNHNTAKDMTAAEKNLVFKWISEGANNN